MRRGWVLMTPQARGGKFPLPERQLDNKLPARLVAPAGLPPPPGLPLVDTFGGGSDADVESESKASGSESGEGAVNYKNLVTWALCWLQMCGS